MAQVKSSGIVPETKQPLPSIQNIIEKNETTEYRNRLPSLGNWINNEHSAMSQMNAQSMMGMNGINGMNGMNGMNTFNVNNESQATLHNGLFNKDRVFRQASLPYSTNV